MPSLPLPGPATTLIQLAILHHLSRISAPKRMHGPTLHVHLRIPRYSSSIRYERYSRAPASGTYSLVPLRLTSIDCPSGKSVPRNPEVKTKFPLLGSGLQYASL